MKINILLIIFFNFFEALVQLLSKDEEYELELNFLYFDELSFKLIIFEAIL